MHLDNPNYYLVFDRQDCFIAEYTQKELSNLRVQATDEVPTMQEIIASWDRMHAKDAPHRFVEYTPIQTHPLPKDHQGNYTRKSLQGLARIMIDVFTIPLGVSAVVITCDPDGNWVGVASNCEFNYTQEIINSAVAYNNSSVVHHPENSSQ